MGVLDALKETTVQPMVQIDWLGALIFTYTRTHTHTVFTSRSVDLPVPGSQALEKAPDMMMAKAQKQDLTQNPKNRRKTPAL